MTELAEVGTGRGIGLAEEVVVADLLLVPLLCNGLANRGLRGAEIASTTDTSEVLAVVTVTLGPIELSAYWASVSRQSGVTYMSCANWHLLAVFSAY